MTLSVAPTAQRRIENSVSQNMCKGAVLALLADLLLHSHGTGELYMFIDENSGNRLKNVPRYELDNQVNIFHSLSSETS
jgi:hypothetical protein